MEPFKPEFMTESKKEFIKNLMLEEKRLLGELEAGNYKAIEALILMSKLAQGRAKEY